MVSLASLAIYKARSVTEPDRQKLEAWIREAVRRQPDDLLVNTKLANLRGLQGNSAEAEAIYRRLLAGNRNNIEVLNNLAWQLVLSNKNLKEALGLVDRAIDIAGPDPALLDTRAVVLMRLGQADEAQRVLREAVNSDPDGAIYYFHLARALKMTDSRSEAREAFARSRQLGLTAASLAPPERRGLSFAMPGVPLQ